MKLQRYNKIKMWSTINAGNTLGNGKNQSETVVKLND